jgi:hypothetical protein
MEESQPFLKAKAMFEAPDQKRKRLPFLRDQSALCTHFAVFVVTSGIWACLLLLINYFAPLSSNPPPIPTIKAVEPSHGHGFLATEMEYLTCGTSLAEAKRRNCTYDILSNAWIPSPCSDENSIQEYQTDGSWFPFADSNHTQPLEREELGDLGMYYTNMRDHIVHCAVLWKRQFRAWKEGWKYLDDVLVDEKHTMHCADFLVDMTDKGTDFRKQPIEVIVGHVGCHVRNV